MLNPGFSSEISCLVIASFAGWLAHPLRVLTRCARSIAAGDTSARTGLQAQAGPLHLVGATLDRTLDRLQHAASRQKTLVDDISHELRTPLAALAGQIHVLQALRRDDDPPRRAVALARAERDLDRVVKLVEDLLTLARTEDAPFDPTSFRASDWIQGALAPVRQLHPHRSVRLSCDSSARLSGERDVLSRALTNVLLNACAYTPPDTPIDLSCRLHATHLELAVQDHGPGLPAETLVHLGQPLHRPDPSRSRQTGGSGLGLAIARAAVERHSGSLRIESCSRGTRVSFTLPT